MGKDKKEKKGVGDIASFRTKDALREEDVELTKQLHNLERKYKELYKPAYNLSVTYESCKDTFALIRYGELKDMIKTCVSEEVMGNAAKYSAAQNIEEKGKSASLLQSAKQFSSGMGDVAARDEVSQLHKAEIVQDLEDKKKKIDKIEKKFLRLHNRLTKLKRDYEESKQHIPTKRYSLMKEMIKPLIRDEALKVEA